MYNSNDQIIYDQYMQQIGENGLGVLSDYKVNSNRFLDQTGLIMFLFSYLLEEVESKCHSLDFLDNKEKVFEIIMIFCDCLKPYKKTITRALNDQIEGGVLIVKLHLKFYNEFHKFLKAQQLLQTKLGKVYVYGFMGLLLCTLERWTKDLSSDQGETMAYLNNLLNKGDALKSSLYNNFGCAL